MSDNEILRKHPGEFRYAVARYVRLLIAARMKDDRNFMPAEELERWQIGRYRYEEYESWQLLMLASEALARLNTEFLHRCGSGGVPLVDDSTPVVRLVYEIAFLVEPSGGGPNHNSALVDAAERLRDHGSIDWDKLAQWDRLPAIRDDLDQLPPPVDESCEEGQWSKPLSPKEWVNFFGMGWDTLKKRFDGQQIRNKKLSTRCYRVHLDDVPGSYSE